MKKIIYLSIVLAAVALGTAVSAANFGAGNLVIYRVGTGVGVLTNAGSPIFLDEYATNDGHLVQSVPMPTNYFGANSPLLANGTAFGNGLITRSTDGRFIVVSGCGATLGQFGNSLSTRFATEAPRVIAIVGGNGNIDTTTSLTNSFASTSPNGGEYRSPASTDGTNFWDGGDSLSGGGILYAVRGANSAINLSGLNTRQVQIYSNQLYVTSASFSGVGQTGTVAILTNAFGTTLPTVTNGIGTLAFAPQSTNTLSAWGFALLKLNAGGADPVDTAYILDASSLTSGASKYSLVGGTWVFNGSVGFPQNLVGLAASVNVNGTTTNVDIYVSGGGSTLTGGDSIYRATDATGFNGTPSAFSFTSFIGPTANGKAFRGLTFTPTPGAGDGTLSGAGNISVGPVLGLFDSGLTGCLNGLGTQVFSVANLGTTGPISWQANCPSNWVTLNPPSGSLNSGGSVTVMATFNANATSLPTGTNTSTITFTNTTSALGSTTRAVQLVQRPQTASPTTDFITSGQPGGPFTPSNRVYTISSGSAGLTLAVNQQTNWLNFVVGTTTGTSLSVALGGCASTNITVSVNQTIAAGLSAGLYQDPFTFSNSVTSTLIDSDTGNLTVGGLFFCDDFSTFLQNTALEGQQGWASSTANQSIQVTNNAVYNPAFANGGVADEPYKNIPAYSNNYVFAAMKIMVTSAPPVSTTSPSRGPMFYTLQNLTGGFARDELSARDTGGNTQFVFAVRINGTIPWVFGTTPLNYGVPYNIIIQCVPNGSSFEALYLNPGPTLNTNTAYMVQQLGGGANDAGVGCFSLQSQFSAAATIPSPGYAVFKLCITTNYSDAVADLATVADPFTTWQNTYFTPAELANLAFSGPNADPLGKGISNTNQFLAGFNPTNSAAFPHIINIARTDGTNVTITYLGASGDSTAGTPQYSNRTNVLEVTTGTGGNYSNNYATSGLTNVLSGGTGLGQLATFVHTNGATGSPTRFYRIHVLAP